MPLTAIDTIAATTTTTITDLRPIAQPLRVVSTCWRATFFIWQPKRTATNMWRPPRNSWTTLDGSISSTLVSSLKALMLLTSPCPPCSTDRAVEDGPQGGSWQAVGVFGLPRQPVQHHPWAVHWSAGGPPQVSCRFSGSSAEWVQASLHHQDCNFEECWHRLDVLFDVKEEFYMLCQGCHQSLQCYYERFMNQVDVMEEVGITIADEALVTLIANSNNWCNAPTNED